MTIQEIKKSAKLSLKGNYIRCASANLLYFLLVMVLTYILDLISLKFDNHTIILTIFQAIFGIISIVLSYGIISNTLSIIDGKTKSITKFVDIFFLNFVKYIKVFFQLLIRILIPLFIFLLCIFYLIGTLVANANQVNFLCFYADLLPLSIIITIVSFCFLLYFILKYALVSYIYNSNKDLSSKEIVKKSSELMKKQKLNYIGLLLSFFGWILLMTIIIYILNYFIDTPWLTPFIIVFYSLLKPYIIKSESIFYENLNETTESK